MRAIDCNCDPAGVVEGFGGCGTVPKGELCQCKERVQGRICNQCKPLYWNMETSNPLGCKGQLLYSNSNCGYGFVNFTSLISSNWIDCDCVTAGTVGSLRICHPEHGQCSCKARVTERRCSDCADGFFNLQEDNPFGCMGNIEFNFD